MKDQLNDIIAYVTYPFTQSILFVCLFVHIPQYQPLVSVEKSGYACWVYRTHAKIVKSKNKLRELKNNN